MEPARQEGQQGAEGCRGKVLCAWHGGSASMRNALHISKSAPLKDSLFHQTHSEGT